MSYSYYIAIRSGEHLALRYVTDIEGNYASWEDGKPAKAFTSEEIPTEVMHNLNMYGFKAFLIKAPSYMRFKN